MGKVKTHSSDGERTHDMEIIRKILYDDRSLNTQNIILIDPIANVCDARTSFKWFRLREHQIHNEGYNACTLAGIEVIQVLRVMFKNIRSP